MAIKDEGFGDQEPKTAEEAETLYISKLMEHDYDFIKQQQANMQSDNIEMESMNPLNRRDMHILELTEGGPMETHFNADKEGVLKAEYTTYEKKGGVLYKRTTVRKYSEDGNYHDHYTSEPLISL